MELGKAGWLGTLIAEAVSAHDVAAAKALNPTTAMSPRARARAYVRRVVRESGLLYGTPTTRGQQSADSARAPEELLFLAVMRTFARIALDVSVLTDSPNASRADQLLILFAALTGDLDSLQSLQNKPKPSAFKRAASRVESRLEERAMSLAGDPAYGLALHNGAVYVDAQVFGRLAIHLFSRGALSGEAASRRLDFSARQKALLVEVLTALSCIERKPNFSSRRAILRQIEDLHLPDSVEEPLRTHVKKTFDKVPPLAAIVEGVRSRDLRRFILEQALLASLVDGRRSGAELKFLQELAVHLGFSRDELARVEVEMAEFYAKNRSVLDVFTVSAAAGTMGEELVANMQSTLEKNFYRLLQEIRETGELSVLLAKAARGQKLTTEERAAMREQLIDVAKAIPALAIFAAPGGILLLIALAKVLPFNLLPSSFQDDEDEASEEEDRAE
ncbi:MAG: LETM1 domain-containing protein [Myxococcaceae bacterium]